MRFGLFGLVVVAILAFSLMGCVLAGSQNKENSQAGSPNSQEAQNRQIDSQSGSPTSQTGSPSPQDANQQANSQADAPNSQNASQQNNSQAGPSVDEVMLGFNQYDKQKFFNPQEECVAACKFAERYNISLRNGPCLLNPMPQHPDYVCDVAHKPRQAVDNDQINQCSAFRKGTANRFVEVGQECEVIDVY